MSAFKQQPQNDAAKLARMSRTERHDFIASETRTTNEPQITTPPDAVDALLLAMEKTPKYRLAQDYSASASLILINDDWGVDMASFPALHHGRNFRPDGEASTWDLRLLVTLAILSECTPGQRSSMGILVCYAVELRVGSGKGKKDLVVRAVDVKRVIRDILKPLRDPHEKPELVRKRKSACDDRRKSSKKTRDEDGAEAALYEIVMDDMGRKMETTGVMSDEEEDDM